MSFDWNKWSAAGADPSQLPFEERAKLQNAWQQGQPSDPLDGLFGSGPASGEGDEPLTRGDLQNFFNAAETQASRRFELDAVKRQLSTEDYEKYAPVARQYISKGLGPKDAFRLAGHDDAIAAAAESARTSALSGVQTQARNSETVARGNGTSGSGINTTEGGTGNRYIDDPEAYAAERKRLGSARVDFQEARRFRIDNPEFVAAEKHNGDLVGVSRR